MPRIKDEYLECAIYLYRSRHEADEGMEMGGSGFLVSVPAKRLPRPMGFVYAVTNRHVIEAGAVVVRVNTSDGYQDVFPFERRRWITSPTDDLAICPLPVLDRDTYKLRALDTAMFLTQERAHHYNVGIGDETFMVGRFINHAGKQRNNPSVRFGAIAQMPGEPIAIEVGSKVNEQESYLVETRSIGGFSGSPVFLNMDRVYERLERPGLTPDRTYLLGVDWGHIRDWECVCGSDHKPLPGSGLWVEKNTGMAGVVPAWKLLSLLESEDLQSVHDASEEETLRRMAMPAGVADGSSTTRGGNDGGQTG